MITANDYQQAYQRLMSAANILLVTHNDPDGDALGSLGALACLLIAKNKTFSAWCFDPAPAGLRFLPGADKIISDRAQINFADFDLIISLDCGTVRRTKLEDLIANRRSDQYFLEIDHHPKVEELSDCQLRDPEAAATTELIYDFFKANDLAIDQNIATCILTGILTDTGNFIYPSTSRHTVLIAAEMLSLGARLPKIIEHTTRNKSLASMKIWGLAMSRLWIDQKNNMAVTGITQADLQANNINEDELEGIAGFLSSIPDVAVSLFLRETADGFVKGSLRANQSQVDVSELAKKFGGGGHAKASGFMVRGKILINNEGIKIV